MARAPTLTVLRQLSNRRAGGARRNSPRVERADGGLRCALPALQFHSFRLGPAVLRRLVQLDVIIMSAGLRLEAEEPLPLPDWRLRGNEEESGTR